MFEENRKKDTKRKKCKEGRVNKDTGKRKRKKDAQRRMQKEGCVEKDQKEGSMKNPPPPKKKILLSDLTIFGVENCAKMAILRADFH